MLAPAETESVKRGEVRQPATAQIQPVVETVSASEVSARFLESVSMPSLCIPGVTKSLVTLAQIGHAILHLALLIVWMGFVFANLASVQSEAFVCLGLAAENLPQSRNAKHLQI
jgi:hypothetical protein